MVNEDGTADDTEEKRGFDHDKYYEEQIHLDESIPVEEEQELEQEEEQSDEGEDVAVFLTSGPQHDDEEDGNDQYVGMVSSGDFPPLA